MAEWITTAEAAKVSGYHPEHIRRLVKSKKVKAQKFGEVWQIDRRSLLEYVRKSEQAGAKRGPKQAD